MIETKHASWINAIEMFFSKIAQTMLKAIRVKSKEEPIKRIKKYLREMEVSPVLFDGSIILKPFNELLCGFEINLPVSPMLYGYTFSHKYTM